MDTEFSITISTLSFLTSIRTVTSLKNSYFQFWSLLCFCAQSKLQVVICSSKTRSQQDASLGQTWSRQLVGRAGSSPKSQVRSSRPRLGQVQTADGPPSSCHRGLWTRFCPQATTTGGPILGKCPPPHEWALQQGMSCLSHWPLLLNFQTAQHQTFLMMSIPI